MIERIDAKGHDRIHGRFRNILLCNQLGRGCTNEQQEKEDRAEHGVGAFVKGPERVEGRT